MQPGDTVQPGQTPHQPEGSDPSHKTEQPMADAPATRQAPETSWQFSGATSSTPSADSSQASANYSEEIVKWKSAEYTFRDKATSWYALFVCASILLTVGVYFFTKDMISTVVVVIIAVVFGVSAHGRPRIIEYAITDYGIKAGTRRYGYDVLKSFSIQVEDNLHTIILTPMKRFMPIIPINYPPEQEDQIASALAQRLPFEQRPPDPVDRFMHRIRF